MKYGELLNTSLIFGMLLLLLTSCIGPKKMDKFISRQYGETIQNNKMKSDYITITSPLLTNDDIPSTSTKKTKKFLPLLFFWKIDYQVSSTLNPRIPINLYTSNFFSYARNSKLAEKMNGSKIEMSIDQVPSSFSFNDDYTLIFLVVAKIDWDKIYLLPDNKEMSISYKVTNNKGEVKNGLINIPDPNKLKQPRFFQSLKKATAEYLAKYDENIKAMAKQTVDKLIAEL